MTPAALDPPYAVKTEEDALFEEEMKAAMERLKAEAIAPLPVPAMDLCVWERSVTDRSQIDLVRLKQLPLPMLATLVMMNLFNEPKGEASSLKREVTEQEVESKRRQTDASALLAPELFDAPTRTQLHASFMTAALQLTSAPIEVGVCGVADDQSKAREIVLSGVVSLLTLMDQDRGECGECA